MATRKSKPTDRLEEYRRKRSADGTPEPFVSGGGEERPRLFVVQKHAARNMHYDLRLEMSGALQSWAVPKGPSLDPQEKRLAVLVEEHPIEYADFEGKIPAGNYGAGAVIVWDRGRWVPIGDPEEGLESGKLLFDLEGYKLRGRWTLFRTKRSPKEWLLMKKPDGEADPEKELAQQSVRSGLTVEQLRDDFDPAKALLAKLKKWKAPRRKLSFGSLEPMLAQPHAEAFSRKGWLFELKYDGYRLMGRREGEKAALRYRRGSDVTELFPEISSALQALPLEDFIVDGEVVVLDAEGKPSFQRLQRRVHLKHRREITRATVELPATFFIFDLLGFGGYDLRSLPLTRRKEILEGLLPPWGPLRYSDHIEEHGAAMFQGVERMGLEGIVAKRGSAAYQSGKRSDDWLKIRADKTDDFVIVGFSPPKRARSGFGALHIAVHQGGELTYAGRVGTGFTAKQLKELHALLLVDRRDGAPCVGELPTEEGQTWVEPCNVCEVRYKEWTDAGNLRHPVFLHLREDKPPEECIRQVEEESAPEPVADQPVERIVSFTNLTKVFWPEEGYTKGDLIEYYRSISPWLLPYLADRPIVLTRYPDGIDGKSFFQKDAPSYIPDWVRTERMWSEHAEREIHYFIVDDEETLLYLINLGSIPLHLWSSRVSTLQSPDWCILDLDPKEAPFEHVIQLARAIHKLCDAIGLPSFVKTSGSSGLHVLIPLGGQCTYEQSRGFGEVMARFLVSRHREIATVTRSPRAREGKVYIDYLQNGHGRLLVSPFCVRPLPVAPVSTTLRWSEVKRGLDIRKFNIRTVPRRLQRMKQEPMLEVLDLRPDLHEALSLLHEQMD